MIRILSLTLLAITLSGCPASIRYPNWEYVRIEGSVPTEQCRYIVQESCPETALEGCYTYYKKRATRFDANTVVITSQNLANYYACP